MTRDEILAAAKRIQQEEAAYVLPPPSYLYADLDKLANAGDTHVLDIFEARWVSWRKMTSSDRAMSHAAAQQVEREADAPKVEAWAEFDAAVAKVRRWGDSLFPAPSREIARFGNPDVWFSGYEALGAKPPQE